ncbi:MAG: carbohydrate ABC transporter permease, partial [Oscillospiraceae bacterium]
MKCFQKKDSGVITSTDLKSVHVKIAYWVMFGVLILISIVCLFPPLWVFMSSFKDLKEFVSSPPTIIPRSFQPEKLAIVWEKLNFMKYYLNTFILAIGDLVFCVVANGLMGYVLSRIKP